MSPRLEGSPVVFRTAVLTKAETTGDASDTTCGQRMRHPALGKVRTQRARTRSVTRRSSPSRPCFEGTSRGPRAGRGAKNGTSPWSAETMRRDQRLDRQLGDGVLRGALLARGLRAVARGASRQVRVAG